MRQWPDCPDKYRKRDNHQQRQAKPGVEERKCYRPDNNHDNQGNVGGGAHVKESGYRAPEITDYQRADQLVALIPGRPKDEEPRREKDQRIDERRKAGDYRASGRDEHQIGESGSDQNYSPILQEKVARAILTLQEQKDRRSQKSHAEKHANKDNRHAWLRKSRGQTRCDRQQEKQLQRIASRSKAGA